MTISWKGKEARVPVECQLVSDAKQIEEVEKESSEEEVEEEIEILILANLSDCYLGMPHIYIVLEAPERIKSIEIRTVLQVDRLACIVVSINME
ncbi:unnamed protein product [Rhizophagus irregularis]|nr:unnamed protein product [Rhizophagus irregularis]